LQFCWVGPTVWVWEIARANDHYFFYPRDWLDVIWGALGGGGLRRKPELLEIIDAPDDIAAFPAACERWAVDHGWEPS
jgi:hypothetical protein